VDTVVWQGSGSAWPGASWDEALVRRLTGLGRRPTVVPWGDRGDEHVGRGGVLHVFTGGLEPVSSGSVETAARLDAVRAAVGTAERNGCWVVGICLGAQMIAAIVSGLAPRPVAGGGEAGLTLVSGCAPDVPDLVVPTAHVAEVPEPFLAVPGVRHLWRTPVTTVQGFTVGHRVVGVQFHPEFSAPEARRAARSFRRELGAPPVWAPAQAVDPDGALRAVLGQAGVDCPLPATELERRLVAAAEAPEDEAGVVLEAV
jgi:GMP synthase-like glutamine amidotransferase